MRVAENIAQIEFLEEVKVSTGIWIYDAGTTPYHLGFSVAGKYFSLRIRNKDQGVDVGKILQLLDKQKKSAVYFPLMVAFSEDYVQGVFERYTNCQVNNCSCIRPILDVLGLTEPNWVLFDLLDYLDVAGQMESILGYRLPESSVELIPYQYEDVQMNLKALQC